MSLPRSPRFRRSRDGARLPRLATAGQHPAAHRRRQAFPDPRRRAREFQRIERGLHAAALAAAEGDELNTVLAPVEWDLIEPVEGKFDWTSVDELLRDARAHDLKLVILWFGAWKNSMSTYVPSWVKRDQHRFPRVAACRWHRAWRSSRRFRRTRATPTCAPSARSWST